MDPYFQSIKSVLSSGLTILTMRAGPENTMSGLIRIGMGAAQAAIMKRAWEGLPHFAEHMVLNGASCKYEPDQVKNLMIDEYFVDPNASTGLVETLYFTTRDRPYVFANRDFWPAFEVVADGVYFPKFDKSTRERERNRILEETKGRKNPSVIVEQNFWSSIYSSERFRLSALGTAEQVGAYTQADLFELHKRGYGLLNTTISVVGGKVSHEEVVERVESILSGVSSGDLVAPLPKLKFQSGEFRTPDKDANRGHLKIHLNFPSVNVTDSRFSATVIANEALSRIIDDEVKQKYGLYTAHIDFSGWRSDAPLSTLTLATGDKKKATDALRFAVDLLQRPQTYALVAERHNKLIARKVSDAEKMQTPIEGMVDLMMQEHAIGASETSLDGWLQGFRNTTPDQVAEAITAINTGQVFLEVRGHKRALGVVPSVDVIDKWRNPTRKEDGGKWWDRLLKFRI